MFAASRSASPGFSEGKIIFPGIVKSQGDAVAASPHSGRLLGPKDSQQHLSNTQKTHHERLGGLKICSARGIEGEMKNFSLLQGTELTEQHTPIILSQCILYSGVKLSASQFCIYFMCICEAQSTQCKKADKRSMAEAMQKAPEVLFQLSCFI